MQFKKFRNILRKNLEKYMRRKICKNIHGAKKSAKFSIKILPKIFRKILDPSSLFFSSHKNYLKQG